jgi:hypothetical protein
MRSSQIAIALLLSAGMGCSSPPAPSHEDRTPPSPAEPAPAEPEARPAPPALSAEDLALIEADPATLTPEQRRARAYALRRKVMQDPDSPAARTLEDLRRAHEEGVLELPPIEDDGGVVFSTPGTRPAGGPGPAGARPEPEAGSPSSDETAPGR